MIVEQIIYGLHPGKAPVLVAAYEAEGLKVISRHLGRLVAWLVTDAGDLDEVCHIWAFEDAADRERRHAALAADPVWRRFTGTHGHLLVRRRNHIWRAVLAEPRAAGEDPV